MAKKRSVSKSGPVQYHEGKFPPRSLQWERLIPLIGPANAALSRYDGLLSGIPNAAILLSPMTTQEAVLSSRIEGTQATMGEVLEYEAGAGPDDLSPEKIEDIHEITNYRKAMREAERRMAELPLCGRLLREVHAILMDGVRGEDKGRGRFRTIPNYIGTFGRPIEDARFVPISPGQVEPGMSRWEKYLHGTEPDALVQLAIVHAEFESLHPFLDGNGRLGRMLIPLFLYERKLLHAPMFYLSEFLETNRQQYYDHLLAVSRDDDWTTWCEFFLRAVTEQAQLNQYRALKILQLYESKKQEVVELTHSQHAIGALDFLFGQPIFNASSLIASSSVPAPSARRILRLLVDAGMLRILRPGKGQKSSVYAFTELLEITELSPHF